MQGLSSVQSFSCVWLFVTPWTAALQASLSITNSRSLLKLMSIESVMPSNHLILCRPLLFLPSIFPSIRVFSNELVLHIRWPKYWGFSFNISPSNSKGYWILERTFLRKLFEYHISPSVTTSVYQWIKMIGWIFQFLRHIMVPHFLVIILLGGVV